MVKLIPASKSLLEGVRSVGAVKPVFNLRPATAARDRSPPAIIVGHQPMPLPADPLEGVRSVGAVKWCQFTAGNGCEGPQPSRPPPIIVATTRWTLLADPLEGVRSVGAVKWREPQTLNPQLQTPNGEVRTPNLERER